MKRFPAFAFLFVAIAASAAFAQKVPDKPYTEWNKDVAMKLVNDSPWAKTYSSTEGKAAAEQSNISREQRQTANSGGGNPGSVARSGGNPPIVIRLHSAPVIRQATVRLQQLNVKYDKMSDAEKTAFDANRKVFLECAICKDYYVVTITKFADATGESVSDGIFSGLKLEDVKGNIALVNDKGERREVAQFTPSKGGSDASVFFFKRLDDNGHPLLTPETKELQFVFSNTFIDMNKRDAGLYPRRFEFSVPKMVVNGEVMF